VDAIAGLLAAAGIENAAREAAWIVADAPSSADAEAWARRRVEGEPLQYILGTVAFRHLTLSIGPGVFIPRPETEEVAGRAIALLEDGGVAVDLCTGSGAIALALAEECRGSRVFATESSAEALTWARLNADRRGAGVTFLEGNLFAPLPAALRGSVDVVVSNPPYIAFDEADVLPAEVIDHEPHEALLSGVDGLDVVDAIVEEAPAWLRPGGALVLEIGEKQGGAVRELLRRAGYGEIEISPDLTGRDRIAEGRVR
jgi:release factor glutamine methyltransferase